MLELLRAPSIWQISDTCDPRLITGNQLNGKTTTTTTQRCQAMTANQQPHQQQHQLLNIQPAPQQQFNQINGQQQHQDIWTSHGPLT